MRATISDVAEMAGVSTATVSRVLSGAQTVLPDTRQRVEEAMASLDYRPSGVARSLRRQTTEVIGLVVTDISNPFYPDLVRGVEDEVQAKGRSVLLCNAAENAEREERYLDVLAEQRVDAIVVASSGLTRRYAHRLYRYPVPVVLVNVVSPDRRLIALAADNRHGGRLAARHLLECGYERVVYISGALEEGDTSLRQAGVIDVVGDDLIVVSGDGHLEGGARAMQEIATLVRPPFGVAAHNDLSAIGALSVLRERGWDVPEEVGVVGFDDIAMSRFVSPPLTTIVQDQYGMGVRAAQTVHHLLDRNSEVDNRTGGTELLPVELLQRESTTVRAPS